MELGQPQARVAGIDLGTTNSLIAFMAGDVPVIIPGEDGSNLVPSLVAIPPARENGGSGEAEPLVGNPARKILVAHPGRAIYSVKRLMGRGVNDIQEELKLFPFHLAENAGPEQVLRIRLGEKEFTPRKSLH